MVIDEVNNGFVQTNLLSKVQLSDGTTYYLKDAEVREILKKLTKAAFTQLSDGSVNAGDAGLVTGAQVANAIKGLTGAMHFAGVVANGERPASPKQGDIIIEEGTSKEYVYDGKKWVELGDEGLYVTKATTIAGIDLQNNITDVELANALSNQLKTSLELGALAYADTASGTGKVNTIDSIELDRLTVAGNATVTSSDATVSSSGEYTPTGTITITGNVVSGATFGATNAEDQDGIQITGTVSKPAITVTPTAKEITHEVVENKGTIATWTGATYTAPALGEASKSQFATNGVVANMSGSDPEMLVFTSAATSDALTAQGAFSAGSVNFGTFNGGSMPTYKTFKETVLGSVTAELSSAPQFTGDKFKVSTSSAANGLKADFVGTQATLSVSGTYQKANANAAYSVEVAPSVKTINSSEKTVSVKVSPDAKA